MYLILAAESYKFHNLDCHHVRAMCISVCVCAWCVVLVQTVRRVALWCGRRTHELDTI